MLNIRPLSVADPAEVEALLDAAFGADRHGRTAYRIRHGMAPVPELCFAAFDSDGLVGTIQSWPICLTTTQGELEPLILVGPVAVSPTRQRGGIGVRLMQEMLAAAEARGDDALVLIGDPEYYQRHFGFNAAHTGNWEVPGPVERHRLLARIAGERMAGRSGMLGPLPA